MDQTLEGGNVVRQMHKFGIDIRTHLSDWLEKNERSFEMSEYFHELIENCLES